MTKPRATAVSVDPTGLTTVTSTDVQGAIEELDAATGGSGYTDEQVRDVIGAALVAGSNMTITVNDGADTITLAASTGGSGVSGLTGTLPVGYASGAASVTPPDRVDSGDLVIYFTRGGSAVTPPSWCTEVDDGQGNAGNYYSFGWGRPANADLPGPWAWTNAGATNLYVYRAAGTPSFGTVQKITTLTATTVTTGTVTGLSAEDRVVWLLGTASNGNPLMTFSAGGAARGSARNSTFWATGILDALAESGAVPAMTASWTNVSDYVYVPVTVPAA